jgi:hypothetical protein
MMAAALREKSADVTFSRLAAPVLDFVAASGIAASRCWKAYMNSLGQVLQALGDPILAAPLGDPVSPRRPSKVSIAWAFAR